MHYIKQYFLISEFIIKQIVLYSCYVLIGIGLLFVIYFIVTIARLIIHRLASYEAVNVIYPILNSSIDNAFNWLYKNHLIVFKLDRVALDKKTMHELEKEFTNLVFDQLGPANKWILSLVYGSYDTLQFYILLEFRKRLDDNIIRTDLKNNNPIITSRDLEEEKERI